MVVAGAAVLGAPPATAAGPSVVSQTFSYTGSTSTFTVPSGITSLNVTVQGAEAGRGGPDASGLPPIGGYLGVVSGTISVTAGQVLTVGVGSGGANGRGGAGSSIPANWLVGAALGGSNPLGYGGGNGGVAGFQGSSGYGGGGGAASVLQVGGASIVAGGSGGSGGSGQYAPTLGRLSYSTFSGRTDITSTAGQAGITVATVCNNAPSPGCDGGGSGGGGGGAQGGAQGQVQFGSGTSNEWYGYGGYPGQNATAGLSGLSSSYQYYSDNTNAAGFVTISYTTGPPAAPTNVAGVAQDSAVALSWTAPTNIGGAALSDYVVQYAPASSPTSWVTFNDGVSANTGTVVTGLTDGTAFVFQVAAVNSFGTGPYSVASTSVSPSGPPSAPTISSLAPRDGALQVAFPVTASGSPIINYQYELNGGGQWVSAGTTNSPFTIGGLTNGTQYSVRIRAVSAIGVGAPSTPATGIPAAPPGAPTITSVTTGVGQATVAFTPGYLGGASVTGYDYQLNGGAWVSAGTTTSPFTITDLSNGTAYSVAIRADSLSGNGTASQPSSITTPNVPGAPTISSIATGDRTISISFTPGSSGGTTVTEYDYQLTSGGPWTAAPSLVSPIVVNELTNGTPYVVSVRAVNLVGPGAGSGTVSTTPATVPDAPMLVGSTVSGSNSQLSADFTAPASDGGSAVTGYQYSTDGGATWRARQDGGTTAAPVVISTLSADVTTPLANGTTYFVELRAINAKGAGQASAVATGIASTTPSAPTISAVTSAPSSLSVSFAPASNGGARITGYEYQVDGGSWTDTGTLSNSFVITGLSNGASYAVSVRARNGNGTGDPSPTVSGTPATSPSQPVITGVSRLDRALSVSVTDASDGGTPITSWQYSTDGGTTWASTPVTGGQLTITTISSNGTTQIANGTTYPVVVRAINSAGASVASLVTTVGPSAVPSAPVVTLSVADQSITAAFTVTSNGGSPITAVEYRLNGGNWLDAGTLTSPFSILGLTNGTSYSVAIRADNVIGAGASSIPASATPAGLPDAPIAVAAVSNTGAADVSWTAPASNGGAAITSYVASAYTSVGASVASATCTTATTGCSITGLTNNTNYYISVVAQNSTGYSQASTPRVLVTPLTRPDAPTLNSLTAGNAMLTLAYTAGNAGDKPITGYQYQINGGGWQNAVSTSSPLALSGLANGTSYTVALRAVSAAGVGTASTTLTATPYTYPDAPDPLSITANGINSAAVVSWLAPANNGSAITSYTATAFNAASAGSQVNTCSTTGALTCTISGLTNGTTYYISLQAGSSAGLSVRSNPRVAVTPSLTPGAVSNVTGVAGNGSVNLSWIGGSTGNSAITDYTIWSSSGGAYTQFADGVSTSTNATVTGLTNGTPYTFIIYAVNASGAGPASVASSPVTPLAPGIVPTASAPASTAGGFTFTINNYSAGTTYTLSASNAATVSRSGSTVTVSGLAAGAGSTITISAAATGFTTASLSVPGTALLAGVAPTFGAVTRTSDGYTFTVSNYVPAALYTFSATNSAVVTQSGSTVTVTGLAPATASTVTVAVANPGYASASASQSGTSLGAGTTAMASAPVGTADGFTFTITNYSAGTSYSLAATNAATATLNGSMVTVTGLAPGASSTVTISAAVAGFTATSLNVTGSALLAGITPTFGSVTRTPDGFTFQISNFDIAATYTFSASSGVVTATGSQVAVTGLTAGQSAGITVTASRTGHTQASATETNAALGTGIAPALDNLTQTVDGFTFDISNYSAGLLYTFVADNGATVTASGPHVVITGLAPGATSSITVTVDDPNVSIASATIGSSALLTGAAPTLSVPVAAAAGYALAITNYSASITYTASVTSGSASVSGGTVTVNGLASGVVATVTVTATRSGYTTTSASTMGAALNTGVVPTAAAPVSTAQGFTFTISNYSAGTIYGLNATNGATVTRNGSTVTVSGLAPGAGATVTIAAAVAGYTTTTLDVDGSALQAGITPAFTAGTSSLGGFSFQISNFDVAALYTFSATSGTVTVTGSQVTVSGLTQGQSSDVTVTVSRAGYTDASATETGTALLLATTPTLSVPVSGVGGFSFTITNYSSAESYSAVATSGATATVNGPDVTVTGLPDGISSAVTVTASQPGYVAASAAVTGSALPAGTVPTASAPASTVDGFTFAITNYDPTTTYTLGASNGAVVARNGEAVTVTGLAPGAGSTVTIFAAAAGATTTTLDVLGAALLTGTTPTLTAPTPTLNGFTFQISNYDPTAMYTFSANNGAVVTATGSHVVVSGLAPGQSSHVTVTASSAGYTDGTSSVTGSPLSPGATPILSAPVATMNGFTFDITNFSPSDAYTFSATNGGSTLLNGSTVTVTGLAPGASSTVTVISSRPGYTDASASQEGSALGTGAAPTASAPVSTLDGFTFVITNYNPAMTYRVTATNGTTVMNNGGAVTVTGLAPGAVCTVTVSATAPGFTDSSLDVPGSALMLGVAPTFGAPTRTADGFTIQITNFDPSEQYTFGATNGAIVTINGSLLVVSGLPAGGSATVSVTAALSGSADASASVTGTALDATPTPTPSPIPSPTLTPSPAPSAGPSPFVSNGLGDGSNGQGLGRTTPVTPTGNRPSTSVVPGSRSSNSRGTNLAIAELAPGTGAATINGVKVPQTLTPGDKGGVVLTAGDLTMELAALVNGHEVVLKPGEYLTVQQGGQVSVVLRGFKSGSKADIWGHSTPMHLDGFVIASDNSGRTEFHLPSALKSGNHTLIATGWAANGKRAAMAVGIRILAAAAPTDTHRESGPGSSFNWWWLLLLLLPVGALAWYLLVWRRRDEEDDAADESQSPIPSGAPNSSGDHPTFGSPRGLPAQRRTAPGLPESPRALPRQRPAAPQEEHTKILDGE